MDDWTVKVVAESDLAVAVSYRGETFVFAKTFTSHDGGVIQKAHYGTVNSKTFRSCPSCGSERCYRDVEVATGEKLLSGYTPVPGEVVKNNWSECNTCAWNQAS